MRGWKEDDKEQKRVPLQLEPKLIPNELSRSLRGQGSYSWTREVSFLLFSRAITSQVPLHV